MDFPIDEVLELVRTQQTPEKTWEDTLALCRITAPSDLWNVLPAPNIKRDVAAATAWLTSQLAALPEIRGIYLGLDTLNMDGGNGTNIEIGGTVLCDASQDEIDWIYSRLKYGSKHLIYGLYELHAVYSQPQWSKEFGFSDYILFLAYSGIILGQAFVHLPTERALLPAWGFHDGDLFILGRKSPEGFNFVCR